MPTTTLARSATVNIRIEPRQRDLIDRAAAALGKSRSAFMLDAAARSAEELLLDRTLFALDERQWDAFNRALDAAPADNPKLRKLIHTKAPWE
ncbi:MAG: DUF1778 domain-containing protein [Geminicoccaceae bacterium]